MLRDPHSVFAKVVTSPWFTAFTTISLAALYCYFLYNHITAIRTDEINPIIIVFVLMETVILLLLVIRQQPVKKTTDVHGWIFAFLGTFMPFALFPFNTAIIHFELGYTLSLVGGLLAVAAYLSLNTSFGVSPSLRTVKTNGLYRLIRHPMYSSYFFLYSGYLLLVFSPYNAAIVVLMMVCLVMRIQFEEEILLNAPEYKAYREKVRYRLFPLIY